MERVRRIELRLSDWRSDAQPIGHTFRYGWYTARTRNVLVLSEAVCHFPSRQLSKASHAGLQMEQATQSAADATRDPRGEQQENRDHRQDDQGVEDHEY
jgi:hypothetical protein